MNRNRPVGVFDSGVGGLTVVRALRAFLPREALLYLGDTARVPYGTKAPDTVRRYAVTIARFLEQQDVKAIVVACNTASAFAIDAVRDAVSVPVIDVIEPVARAVANDSPSGRIGVLGTRGTVSSGAYPRAILHHRPDARITAQPCPLFVPLAEEGWTDGEVPALVAHRYIDELLQLGPIDSLILGCTHYPLLSAVIRQQLLNQHNAHIELFDSARTTAETTRRVLEDAGVLAEDNQADASRFLVTDDPTSFLRVASRFLGQDIAGAEHVDLR